MDAQTPNLAPIMRYVTKIEICSTADVNEDGYAIFYKFYLNPVWNTQHAVNQIAALTCWNNRFDFEIEEGIGCVVYAGIG